MKFEIAIISKHSIWAEGGPTFDTVEEAVNWIKEHRDKYTWIDFSGDTRYLPLMIYLNFDIMEEIS